MTALEFLSLLFGHESLAGQHLAIWDRQTKQTETFQLPAIAEAAANGSARAASCDVYFGCCPYVKVAPGSRGTADDAGALVGLWADIDVRSPVHAAENLPPDREAAFDLVYECAKPPTVVVSSGYGLQAWWLFSKPLLITNEAERSKASALARGWTEHVRSVAAKHRWHVDPIGDLARVLRLPGTKNHKQGEAKPVEVVRR